MNTDFKDFDNRVISTKRISHFTLTYRDIPVEGNIIEEYWENDMWGESVFDVEIDHNEELSEEDIEVIEDYIRDNME